MFDKAAQISSLANKSAADIGNEVESPQYHEQDIVNENRFVPNVDYSNPDTFARYGLAEEYYKQSVERIYDTFPYDGSLKERLEWENESTYLDLHIYNNLYPRTNGYVIVSSGSWGTTTMPASYSGYGLPSSAEFISFFGGPHPNPEGMSPVAGQFTGSNYYNVSNNRENNLKYDLQNKGVTVEFWLKKDQFITSLTEKEVVFDLWNGQQYGTSDYGRLMVELTGAASGLDPVRVTALSGTIGITRASVATSTFTTASIADGKWHHYAVSLLSASTGIQTRFYVDGNLNNSNITGTAGINEVTGALRAYIGAAITTPPLTAAPAKSGKLSGSVDEFRYWKIQRSSKDIGRYWFDQVGGGTNSDPEPFTDTQETVNTDLGVYFKFNEGITGVTATDQTVLDYSGRISNGTWTGYTVGARQTGSAMVLSNAATTEFKDPIVYSFHPDVEALESRLIVSGSEHDATNNASLYNSIPAWITEQDAESQFNTKYLTQIMASYFDTLHMQMHSANSLKDVRYVSGSDKQIPFADRLLSSNGFIAPDIFVDADVLEKLADRSEDLLYEKSLTDIKNIVYQNIYNNLTYIYKSKGTEKSFRNLIRCFGIDDELIKLNMYAPNTAYEYRENRRSVLVGDRVVNFNTANNKSAVVYSFSSSAGPVGSTGYIPSSAALSGGFAYTLETDVILPRKPDETSDTYFNTNAISSSVFGIHGASTSETDTTWPADDGTNFQVYTVRDEVDSPNVKFVLTGSSGGYVPLLESDLYEDAYDNTRWNLSVRVKPQRYPLAYFVSDAANGSYTVVFTGIEVRGGIVVNQFELSGTVTPPNATFITGSRRPFVGAHRTNFTGSLLHTSDVKVAGTRFWLDYVNTVALTQHALDAENYGALQPSQYAFSFNTTASYGDIKKSETLVLNWEFSQNTGSNASGQFFVADESSGSASPLLVRYGALGNILNRQYTALGDGFGESSTDAIKKEFVIASRLNDIEAIAPAETVDVLNAQEQKLFKIDSRPVDYYFSFEKSMSKVISEEMVNMFGTLKDFNNMIGQPVNRYRPNYKTLNFMRKKFYEKVANSEIDFDHFYEFYKWFDSSLSYMLGELIPASADFAENIRTVVENTTLERNKYRSKFPFIDDMGMVFETAISSNVDYGDAISSPDDDPQGTGFYPTHAPTRRQVGLSERANIKKWKYVHHPVDNTQKEKYLWWKNYAERDQSAITVNSEVNQSRGSILNTIRKDIQREAGRPYRYSVGGQKVLGGVGGKQNKNVNFMFGATNAFGPLVPASNIPANIMLSFDSDVEQLLDTTDEFYPTYKQRIGFGINPRINFDSDIVDKRDGNSVTNFSLYHQSTPVNVYDQKISSSWKEGITITNLHHDFVDSTDIPLQGPFTEKFVGGRQYRHTEINDGSDTRTNRFEGFRIELGLASALTTFSHSGSMGIVPPNYPFMETPAGAAELGFLPELAVRSRFREETAKRPVNIKNILMTTESLKTRLSGVLYHSRIGNYSQNYQVVQTVGRTMNDPFFNDQSFSFATTPETLATRGKFPLDIVEPESLLFDGSDDNILIGNGSTWDSKIGGSGASAAAFSISMWIRPASMGDTNPYLFAFGNNYRRLQINSTSYPGTLRYSIRGGSTAYATSDSNAIVAGQWQHIIVTYSGGNSGDMKIYIDGVLSGTPGTGPASVSAIPSGENCRIGSAMGGTTSNWSGNMCDVAIWDKEFSLAEVAEIYHGGRRWNLKSSTCVSNLVTWYKMGDDSRDSSTGTIYDQMGFANGTPGNFAPGAIQHNSPPFANRDLALIYGVNPDGHLGYALPNRTGANSNHTVFVNRFSSPGGFEVQSRGYMDPAHEELSVYNALPYRNRRVIDYGLSGSASVDPAATRTITVVDQIDKNRGLNQRASLHCGPFGTDAAYGSVTATSTRVDGGLGYSVTPSWHKVNRNAKAIILSSSSGYSNGVVYDNLFVQHQIPRSEQQYLWITSSLAYGETIYGLDLPVCLTSSVLDKLITQGDNQAKTPFVSLNIQTVDPVTASTHTLGYPLSANASASYDNADYWVPPAFDNGTDYFNNLLLTRHGPYQWPTWKQIRVGETKVAQTLRKTNTIGALVPPPLLQDRVSGRTVQYVRGKKSNEFVDFIEQPLSSRHYPVTICLEDNTEDSNPDNNIIMQVTYGNLLDYFSHENLNDRLHLPAPDLYNNALNTVFQYVTSSDMSAVITYSERLYPAETNAYRNIVRRRTEFTIDDIWNPSRFKRSTLLGGATVGRTNSQGATVFSASIWPLDAHLDFTTTCSVLPSDGAGELMNSYTWMSGTYTPSPSGKTYLGATYASRIVAGRPIGPTVYMDCLAGDAMWEAGTQAGKQPYTVYEDYSDSMARRAKDHSIVPEFRISSLLSQYIEDNGGDFLANLNNTLELTGASIADSTQADFFKTYTNSDFLKYFTVVDKEINNKRSGDLKIRRDKISLKCSAMLKFLPYKGFYPAERTLELATLFSQSYSDSYSISVDAAANANRASRMITSPLFSPGILYNTIKSGLAVNNWVMINTASSNENIWKSGFVGIKTGADNIVTELPEGKVEYLDILALSTSSADSNGMQLQKIPFEAIYRPAAYFNQKFITGSMIIDHGVGNALIESDPRPPRMAMPIQGKGLYELAADNFLCESVEFFKDGLSNFVSEREDNFKPVLKGTEYTMKLKIYRTLVPGSPSVGLFNDPEPDRSRFDMYKRISAFGSPLASFAGAGAFAESQASFSHVTPPYFAGTGSAIFTYTAQYTGVPTLDEILSNMSLRYDRMETVRLAISGASGAGDLPQDPRVLMNNSFNLTDYFTEVPQGTNEQKKRWLMQSKFETPILNFAGVPYTPPTGSKVATAQTSSAHEIGLEGMWHQYGSIPTGSDLGVFVEIEKSEDSSTSLADVVGFSAGMPVRVGAVKEQNTLEEAVIAVPFRVMANRRKFFELKGEGLESKMHENLVSLLHKYVFPPKFDFVRHPRVTPIQMYAFEFSAAVTQQDIADMWQNLPPDIAETFEEKEAVVEETELINAILDQADDVQWMVFKVKKRAKQDYEKYRRSLVTNNVSPYGRSVGEYSYNWPYDYFSLVELVKIDESVQYVSADLTDEPDNKVQIVGDVNIVAANPIPVVNLPEGFDR